MHFPDIELEKKLWSKGFKYVVGIDEAGRGPLAGPVSAGAVVIDCEEMINPRVRDSKEMSEKQRLEVVEDIKQRSLAWGVSLVGSDVIDRIGIQDAVKLAMSNALKQVEERLGSNADYLIVDGTNVAYINGYKMERIKQGDLLHYSISAASVIAKVTRDEFMKEMSVKYPLYGFDRHVGYGTKEHIEAIHKYGPCDIHRYTFGFLKEFKR
jgi:ribonuclease HII